MIYEMRYNGKVICDGENRNEVIRQGEEYFRGNSCESGMNYVSVEMHSEDTVEYLELEFYVDGPDYYDSPVRL